MFVSRGDFRSVFGLILLFVTRSVQEFMTFTSQLLVERSQKGSRAALKEQGEELHISRISGAVRQ